MSGSVVAVVVLLDLYCYLISMSCGGRHLHANRLWRVGNEYRDRRDSVPFRTGFQAQQTHR
jgi:hypothetical protein